MTPLADLVAAAYRELNIVNIGRAVTDDEAAEALARLRTMLAGLFGREIGEQMRSWSLAARPAFEQTAVASQENPQAAPRERPPAQVRLLVAADAPARVFLPTPRDGARVSAVDVGMRQESEPEAGDGQVLVLDADGRRIAGAPTLTLVAGFTPRTWFYRDDRAEWIDISAFETMTTSPLPLEFDDVLITGLCLRLAPRHGVALPAETAEIYREGLRALQRRYRQPTPTYSDYDPASRAAQSFGPGWLGGFPG